MPTPAAEAMASVVAHIAPILRGANFRKRRHTFNRPVERGMVHVVNFQMGPHDPPGTQEFPPFRTNLYGLFTVNLGVFVPEMVQQSWAEPMGGWVVEPLCQLRMRLGQLLPEGLDTWWHLERRDAASDVQRALTEGGLPWLDDLTTRAELLEAYRTRGGNSLGMYPRAPLDIAWLLAETDRAEAEKVLREYLASDMNPSHWRWTEGEVRSNGFAHVLDEMPHPSA